MFPSDEQPYPLSSNPPAPRGRSISVRDYKLPKPYRKKRFVEDPTPMSPLRMGLLVFSGLVIVSLVAALAVLAKENLDSPPLLVIAAPMPAAALPLALPAPPVPLMTLQPSPARAMPDPTLAPAVHARAFAPAVARHAPSQKPEPPATDPDVVLITAILMLTAPSGQEP
ncbi:MAG: hypothetical protein V4484_10685 [Pseudomonadota bacterium]